MDFTFPSHYTTGVLNGDDLIFFYYDIGLDHLQGWPAIYDWDSIVDEFKDQLDIDVCSSGQLPQHFIENQIRFTVAADAYGNKESKAEAFFRHLRNAFSHYKVVREGNMYIITDGSNKPTMQGMVEAKVLKSFCFRFMDQREAVLTTAIQ